jgi:septal ring factor EnvC (AmiA/AmiB activator)
MSMFAKIMVVVNFILAVAFLAAAGTLLGAAEDYKSKFEGFQKSALAEEAALKDQVTAATNKANEAGARFNEAEKTKSAAEGQVKVLQDSNSQLNSANTQTRADLDKLTQAQTDLQGKNTDLNKQLESTRSELATSEAGRKEAMDKNKALSDDIARLTQDKETAEKALAAAAVKEKDLSEQNDSQATLIARYKQEKGPLSGGKVSADIKGVVSAVDNKVDIYVISVGSKDKVEAGDEFTVYRGSQYVSTIIIDKVFPNMASGSTKPGTKKMDVMAGDECATRL